MPRRTANAASNTASRRGVLKTAAAAAVLSAARRHAVHAAGSDVIRAGLVGCGGRGTGAAINAANAGRDVRIVALADIFQERLDAAHAQLKAARPEQVDIPRRNCFVGFDAYRHLIECGVDVVLIAPASHFIPTILKAAIDAGKHVFCEKPHALDIPGLKTTMRASEDARRKGLSVVSGLCWRYDPGVRQTMQRVHDGAIGRIVAIQETYLTSPYIVRPRRPGQSEMEYQMWNWYHFNWLSGDQTAQQLIHSLDKASWALGDKPPLRAWGLGGRQTCLGPEYGDLFDHHSVVFEYPDDVRVYGFCRAQPGCNSSTADLIIGTRGRCHLLGYRIEGEVNWRYEGPRGNMYDIEHQELFAGIRAGRPVNNGDYMCLSTALAIVAQMACYSGNTIPWGKAMESTRSFALPRYGWDVEPPLKPGPDGRYPSAMQGLEERARWISDSPAPGAGAPG